MKSMVFSIVILCSTEGAQNFREEKLGHLQTVTTQMTIFIIINHKSSPWEPQIPQRSWTNRYWTINIYLLMQRSVQSQSCTNNSLQFHQLFIKGIGNWLFVYIPTSMTLYIMYNNYDQHGDETVFYANCHDVTLYIFVENLKTEIGINNTNLRILSMQDNFNITKSSYWQVYWYECP